MGSFVAFLRGWRSPLALAVPLSVVGLGFGIILARRRTRIEAAEEGIRAELDALDPIARAQVLKAVVEEQVGRLSGVGRRD